MIEPFDPFRLQSYTCSLQPKLSAKGAHPYRKRVCFEALRLATTKLTQQGTGYPSWGHPTQLRISRESTGRENQNTHFVFSNVVSSENRAVCEMWETILEQDGPQTTIRCICVTFWITKATNIHSGYVILTAFSTTTVVVRMRQNVILRLHCLSYVGLYRKER